MGGCRDRVAADASSMSDFNAPYVLPRIAVAAVLARDAAGARAALDRAGPARARAGAPWTPTAPRSVPGSPRSRAIAPAALAGYRTGLAAYRDLGLPWDEALLGLQAGVTLGAAEPEVAEWLAASRDILTRLGAMTLVAQADRIAAAGAAPVEPGVASVEGVAPPVA